jgi:hypothetical protein
VHLQGLAELVDARRSPTVTIPQVVSSPITNRPIASRGSSPATSPGTRAAASRRSSPRRSRTARRSPPCSSTSRATPSPSPSPGGSRERAAPWHGLLARTLHDTDGCDPVSPIHAGRTRLSVLP